MNDMFREDRKEFQKMVNFKRDRSPKEVTDEPVLLEMELKYKDDNNKAFCWPVRRQYKQPNKEPSLYCQEAKYIM